MWTLVTNASRLSAKRNLSDALTACCAVQCEVIGQAPRRSQQTAVKPERKKEEAQKSEAKSSQSFCFNVFTGELVLDQVFPYPEVLSPGQKNDLQRLINHYAAWGRGVIDPLQYDETEQVPPDVMKALGDQGAFGSQAPTELGGLGLNNSMAARLGEIVGTMDLGLNAVLGAHQSIGYKAILLVGTEKQKMKYVPKLATGEQLAAFALTEPGSGSDASSIRARAVLNDEKTHFVLNGSKIWITNGGIADVFTVFCKTPVIDDETGVEQDRMTALIVERGFGGVTSGAPCHKMGIRCSNTTEVYFDNVMVPVENVLLEPGKVLKWQCKR